MSDNSSETAAKDTFPSTVHRFQPGESGNPSGRPKGSQNIRTILAQLLEMPDADNPDITRLEKICAKLVVMATHGDLASVDRVFDRLEGKPLQNGKLETANTNLNVTPDDLADKSDEQLIAARKILFGE
jgi:hypothetical protein